MNAEKLMLLAREELRRPPDRTKTRLLARAVLALLARARHADGCDSNMVIDMSEDPLRYMPCDCGLDAAIEGIEDERG